MPKPDQDTINQKEQQESEPDFYLNEQGYVVFTAAYHLKRGYCCGNECKHCPYREQSAINQQP